MAAQPRRPLWAPWRVTYVRAPKDNDCFFCRKAAEPDHDVDNHVLARGDACFVLLNEYPYVSGHLLVAPYQHVDALAAVTPAAAAELLQLVVRSQQVLQQAMAPHGFNVGCNQGRIAGAAVADHIHFHLVPRWSGDTNFMPILAGDQCIIEALDATCTLLRAAWEQAS